MIDVKHITYSYPGAESTPALKGVSFHVESGERIALMGPNGSGKTTLIHCLNGLILPSSGTVSVDDLKTDSDNLFEIRRRVGMVFQNPDNQIVTTTVVRELAFGMENLAVPREEMIERVEQALQQFHLEPYRDTAPHLLSGGERQRLALAGVWVMQPSYLILDEPTSLLDPHGRREILSIIEERVKKDHIGVILVTQFPVEALNYDRLVILNEGKLFLEGSPESVFREVEPLRSIGLSVPMKIEIEQFLKSLENQS